MIEVNIKTHDKTYVMLRNFNPEDHNITIAFPLERKFRWVYKCIKVKLSKLGW